MTTNTTFYTAQEKTRPWEEVMPDELAAWIRNNQYLGGVDIADQLGSYYCLISHMAANDLLGIRYQCLFHLPEYASDPSRDAQGAQTEDLF